MKKQAQLFEILLMVMAIMMASQASLASSSSAQNQAAVPNSQSSVSVDKTKDSIKKLYADILSIQEQIVERSDMRFSDDLAKGEASQSMSLSSQLVTVAADIIRDLNNKIDLIDVTQADYLRAERDLKEIKSEMEKLN